MGRKKPAHFYGEKKMLDSFYIKNFRLFKELKIKTLSRVNLITGKNNSGKSCFLEALRIHATKASPYLLEDLILEREENWEKNIKLSSDIKTVFDNPFRYLFYGYNFPKVDKDYIEIGSLQNKKNRLKLRITECHVVQSIHDNNRTSLNLSDLFKKLDIKDGAEYLQNFYEKQPKNSIIENKFEFGIELEILNQKTVLGYLNTNGEPIMGFSNDLWSKISYVVDPTITIQSISVDRLKEKDIIVLWDKISLEFDLKQHLINAICLFDNQIKSDILPKTILKDIVLIGKEKTTPILIYYNGKKLPLKSLGYGVTRLFYIILALVNVKDGMLLIDEFENGLHYSVQPKIWDVIFKLAETLNIQVFATTHSRDCIRAFHEIWSKPENNDKGCFFRLDHYPEKDIIRPMFYDLEILGDALDVNGEMR